MVKDRYNKPMEPGQVVWSGRSIGIVKPNGKVKMMHGKGEQDPSSCLRCDNLSKLSPSQELWICSQDSTRPQPSPSILTAPETGDAVWWGRELGIVCADGSVLLQDGIRLASTADCTVIVDESVLTERQREWLREASDLERTASYGRRATEIAEALKEPEEVPIEGPKDEITTIFVVDSSFSKQVSEAVEPGIACPPAVEPLEEEVAPKEPAGAPKGIADTLSERGNRYGRFEDHAMLAQALKYEMRRAPKWRQLADDQREALEMIQHKIARILNGDPDYADSWHDIAGYATLIDDRLNGNSH